MKEVDIHLFKFCLREAQKRYGPLPKEELLKKVKELYNKAIQEDTISIIDELVAKGEFEVLPNGRIRMKKKEMKGTQ